MFKFDLLENEKVIKLYRQSEAVLFKPVLIVFVLIYFPWFFLLKYDLAAQYSRLLLFWTLLVFLYALNKYFLWLINVYLLTSKRLVKIAYKNFFNKQVLESPLERILNASFSIKGFWASLFRFGSVSVQVTGLPEPMVLSNVSQPSQVKDLIWQTHNHYSGRDAQPQKPQLPAEPRPAGRPSLARQRRVV